MKPWVESVIKSLADEPDKWKDGEYTLNGPGGVRIWQRNGAMSFPYPHLHLRSPHEAHPGFLGRFILGRTINRWRNRALKELDT